MHPGSNNSLYVGTSSRAFAYIYSYHFINPSDKRQKENISEIDNALNLVQKMQGVKYDIKKDFVPKDSLIRANRKFAQKIEKDRKNQLGFLAQDLQKILPEAVVYDDSTDVYGVNYIAIIPVLVEAIKQQQSQIEQLKNNANFKSAEISDINNSKTAWIGACKPNPFNEQATIGYNIPSDISNAVFYVYDLQGKQIKSVTITNRGKGEININANELEPGMYQYALIADGKLVGIEKMILTQN